MSVEDINRPELILLQVDGNTWFSDSFIMNFESTDKADYQINKNIDNKFLFSAFGHSITTLVIHGFQSGSVTVASKSGNNIKLDKSPINTDIETIYRTHCISSKDPKLVKITTGTSGVCSNGSVYKGLMVAFTKKPMGEDKIVGYGFTLTFVCERDPESGSITPSGGVSSGVRETGEPDVDYNP